MCAVIVSVEDALASGEVVDAKNTQMIPDYLLSTAKMLAAMPDNAVRARTIKNVESAAKMGHDMYFANLREGNKRRDGGKQSKVA